MKIGLLGDVHGNGHWLAHALRTFAKQGVSTIIQVGDLGVDFQRRPALVFDAANTLMEQLGQTMLVAPGNHENYDLIDGLAPNAEGWLPFRERILLASRGLRTTVAGTSFLFIGGAGSVDRQWRLDTDSAENRIRVIAGEPPNAKTWWAQEALTTADVRAATTGGEVDIIISHEAPYPVNFLESRYAQTPNGFPAADVAYSQVVRRTFTEVVDSTRPRLVIHGHHHVAYEDEYQSDRNGINTRVVGLGTDEEDNSMALLDLPGMAITWNASQH